MIESTYLRPMQPLGPSENGFDACNLSVVFSLSIQRSGLNSYGLLKFRSLCVAAHIHTETVVFHSNHVSSSQNLLAMGLHSLLQE
jgi:hypothetical protein